MFTNGDIAEIKSICRVRGLLHFFPKMITTTVFFNNNKKILLINILPFHLILANLSYDNARIYFLVVFTPPYNCSHFWTCHGGGFF